MSQSIGTSHARQEASPLSSFTSKWEYHVFLSFAGDDTRLNFTDHLYDAFIRSGIRCFRDDVDLQRGGTIKQDLFQAIQDSLCAVLVISENYANSTWCLEELEEILESQQKFGRKVFPVFHDVDPSDVRFQRKSFGKALADHERRFKERKDNKVQQWREALSQVSGLSGWDTRNRHETEVIRDIVEAIWNAVFINLPSEDDNLVGTEPTMVEINSLLEITKGGIRFVGIWGMRGVGKTTIARVLFERISGQFQMSFFLANVRQTSERLGLVSLQKYIFSGFSSRRREEIYDEYSGQASLKNLFRGVRVLLVLDDVSHARQLENLARPEWFGEGSRVIITSTDSHLLTSHGVQGIYKVTPMEKDESLQLFSKKAFKKDHPEDDFVVLSETMVKYAGGLPLALEVLGSFLYGRTLLQWEESLERMESIKDKDIYQVLRISYDGLNDEEKTIFLDIGCFFNGMRRDEVAQILKSCDLGPNIGINILIERALLTEKKTFDGETTLEVHDLLQEVARSIVFQESRGHVQGRSRLWNPKDIDEVLKNDKGSEAIQAIALPYNRDGKVEVHYEAFSKMCNLRLLIISSELKLPSGFKCFSRALKVIVWRSFPLETLPIETHQLDKLVDIQMPYSRIKHWNGMQIMENLKFIDLSYSKDMIETPDFSKIRNLEKLNLEGCSSLMTVHDSLGELKRLAEVNLSCCESLENLPKKLEMNSLRELDISWCDQLSVLPEFGYGMKKLTVLNARKSYSITKLPESLGFLTGLRDLNLSGSRLLGLEMSAGFNLTSLTTLDLSGCDLSDGSIPEDLGCLPSLITLHLEANHFANLPTGCFSNLLQLLHLYLNNCASLKSLPKLPPKLVLLEAVGCSSMEPLSSDEMWDLVSSLDHEYRNATNYEKRMLQPIQSGYVPEADFFAAMPGIGMPSWFPNRVSLFSTSIESRIVDWFDEENEGRSLECEGGSLQYEFVVDIPTHFRESKWSGLVVCLEMEFFNMALDTPVISWRCKANSEDYYVCKEWENKITIGYERPHRLCLMLLDFNERTCWRHLRGNNDNRLHIELSVSYKYFRRLSLQCGWRVLREDEIQVRRANTTIDFNTLTEPKHNSYPELPPPPRQDPMAELVDDELPPPPRQDPMEELVDDELPPPPRQDPMAELVDDELPPPPRQDPMAELVDDELPPPPRQDHGHPSRYFSFLILISFVFIFGVKVKKYS